MMLKWVRYKLIDSLGTLALGTYNFKTLPSTFTNVLAFISMGRLLYSWELGTHAISALQTCNIDNENKVTKINGKSMHEEDNLICNFFFKSAS